MFDNNDEEFGSNFQEKLEEIKELLELRKTLADASFSERKLILEEKFRLCGETVVYSKSVGKNIHFQIWQNIDHDHVIVPFTFGEEIDTKEEDKEKDVAILNKLLQKAISNENYILAAELRDKINEINKA